jgi:transposase
VAQGQTPHDKAAALREHHALNPHPEAVTDPAFVGGDPFFDARDVVQVKYEMLRRVHQDAQPVSRAASAFGFSRPSFYQAEAAFTAGGLPGLLPQRPGPRRAHKLSAEVVDFLAQLRSEEPGLRSRDLAERVRSAFQLTVHPRSIERALARHAKRGRHPPR